MLWVSGNFFCTNSCFRVFYRVSVAWGVSLSLEAWKGSWGCIIIWENCCLCFLACFLVQGPSLVLSQSTSSVQFSLKNFWADVLPEKLFGYLNCQNLSMGKCRCRMLVIWFGQSFGVVMQECVYSYVHILFKSSIGWGHICFRHPDKCRHGFRYSYYARWILRCYMCWSWRKRIGNALRQ